ncbi:bifunctional hydroxymethylpyrimidine kinase/phosphomethylpyrimidine kinase [Salipiger abyssi]|uniref:bifunctional hydroxymethylpyrimidine kinase/phosphomethylpyrimidine kinase n=1 Tax=Salipiger abyssi TaxID=1250539 RepID=UPI001A8CA962|nr:bifunctional hydroxymethylpyrimidine kinase/phosphomethylpyrimidine kinase [Salipiger abyssi]MBN9887897.1 bifunctional hydroxymethylpyrimidine kinase/phosphomethylpyrimidine kinase [Salipiger abyssi]
MTPHPSALTIAGSDSGGGAGIQADLKTFSALGVYGTSAITAITAQNTLGVFAVEAMPPALVIAQIAAVLDDIRPQAIKIGMLASSEVAAAVADALNGYGGPVVLDPVMVAKSGDMLLTEDARTALVTRLLPRADVLTPNLPEAARLLGRDQAETAAETEAQGRDLLALGAKAVVMKGGHAEGPTCIDRLIGADTILTLEQPRLATRNTHGTGCSLSSAIAAELAKGATVGDAVARAQVWLHGAIRAADGLGIGAGHGPVHHFHEVWA